MRLSRQAIGRVRSTGVQVPPASNFELPEKVLQFGTGVLLRGLIDYFIDKANKKGLFNGRIVVVKSTESGDSSSFDNQDNLFTHCIRGIEAGQNQEETIINASISRVLSAKTKWDDILALAASPDLELIVSNTTEVGIVLVADDLEASPPISFPGKLLAFLYRRYRVFGGTSSCGLVIVPTELAPNNGRLLLSVLLDQSRLHELEPGFIRWLEEDNCFCSSLVDRIVPGKLPKELQEQEEKLLGYTDDLMIVSESYRLWAIESTGGKARKALSFSEADEGVVITPDIHVYRELKLRLLNGAHTFSCGLAYLAGFRSVKKAMDSFEFSAWIQELMIKEILPSMTSREITPAIALEFAAKVLDRFRNPFIEHPWLNITLQYSSKMRNRNVPLLISYFERTGLVPPCMCWGLAAYLLFMKSKKGADGLYYGELSGSNYAVQDLHAAWFSEQWKVFAPDQLVRNVMSENSLWGSDLSQLPGLVESVSMKLDMMLALGAGVAIKPFAGPPAQARAGQ
jgi:tagaturonate reductase